MLVAVAIVAFLTAGATAVRAVSRLWLRDWIEHRHAHSRAMARYLERPTRLIHAAGTGIMLVVFALGAVLTVASDGSPLAFARDAVIFLLLMLLFGQLIPRAIGRRWAPQLVPILVPTLRVVDVIVSPIQWVARAVGAVVTPNTDGHTEADAREGLEDLLRDGAFDGMGATEEMAIISGVMQFGDKTARDVMTHRADLFALDAALPPMEVARRVAQSAYSRVPMYRESADKMIGMIHVFDVFKLAGEQMPTLRPITVTRANKPANELLFELLRARRQLAIVNDDADNAIGVVTLEDLLEELVGEIRDEHDDPAPRVPGTAS
jgi:putative hemolysin